MRSLQFEVGQTVVVSMQDSTEWGDYSILNAFTVLAPFNARGKLEEWESQNPRAEPDGREDSEDFLGWLCTIGYMQSTPYTEMRTGFGDCIELS